MRSRFDTSAALSLSTRASSSAIRSVVPSCTIALPLAVHRFARQRGLDWCALHASFPHVHIPDKGHI